MKIHDVVQEGVGDWIKGAWKKLTAPGTPPELARAVKATKAKTDKRAATALQNLYQAMADKGLQSVSQQQLVKYLQNNGLGHTKMSEFFTEPSTVYSPKDLKTVMLKYVDFLTKISITSFDVDDEEETADDTPQPTQGELDLGDPNKPQSTGDQDADDILKVRGQ